LLTNSMPPDAIDRAYAKKQLVPPRQLNPKISLQMEQIILTAMQLDPTLRFPDAREMQLALQGSRPPEILSTCPHCQQPVRPNAIFCPSCGKKISTIKPFIFNRAGVRANNLVELVRDIDEHWEEALEYFQRGDLDSWLVNLSPQGEELARQGQTLRLQYTDPSIALESFLRAAAPTRPHPHLEVHPESLDFETLRKGESRSLRLQLANRGRGYLYGTCHTAHPWVLPVPGEFGCLADTEQQIEVRVETSEVQVAGNASQLNSSLQITSNGGDLTIPVSLQVVNTPQPRVGTRFFMDPAMPGTQVSDLPGLVKLCDENWDDAIYWLLSRRIEEFLGSIRQDSLQQAAAVARQQFEPNAGLEDLLRRAGAPPARKFSTNAREVVRQLGFGLFPKRGSPASKVMLTIRNTSPRGYLHGEVKPLVGWLAVPDPRFGCRPGQSAEIELTVSLRVQKAKTLKLREALFELIFL
jgi:hypothetical protein